MQAWRRRRVLVDRKLQGSLLFRVALYWLCCQLSMALMLGCCLALDESPRSSAAWLQQIWVQYGQALIASLLVLPLVLLDCLVISNKFAGPMLRLRRAMKQLADGQPVAPIRFRRGDFWGEFTTEFNRVLARIHVSDANHVEAGPKHCAVTVPDGEPKTTAVT